VERTTVGWVNPERLLALNGLVEAVEANESGNTVALARGIVSKGTVVEPKVLLEAALPGRS
jgi:hypothetical protein